MKRRLLPLLGAVLLAAACADTEEDPTGIGGEEPVVEQRLDGNWTVKATGLVIAFTGDKAVVKGFGESHLGTNPNLFRVGDTYIKDITRTGSDSWSAMIVESETQFSSQQMKDVLVSYAWEPTDIERDGDYLYISNPDGWDISFSPYTGEDPPPPGTPSSAFAGVWNRYGSAYGYKTDLKVGDIPGQPANRVYMCELPGSPSAGLWKGSLRSDGKTIDWDVNHGIPYYIMQSTGSSTMEFYIPDAATFAGKYQKGSWTPGACGLSF